MSLDIEEYVEKLEAEIERLRAHQDALGAALQGGITERDQLRAEIERLRAAQANIKAIVDEQANDEGLWFVDGTCAEAYVQQALRRLHAAIEGKMSEQCAMDALEQKADTE